MKVLSLGAGGFIGTHLTHRLLSEGHQVVGVDIYDDKLTGAISDHPRLRFIQQDIRQSAWDLEPLVKDADVVIDLIAYANPGLYVKMPLEVFRLNFTENLKIAEACLKHKKRLVQFSTCEVYGRTVCTLLDGEMPARDDPRHATFSEDTSAFILGPVEKHRWIYACAKQLLERVIHAYGLEHDFNYTIIRPFNFIGPKIDYLLNETDGIPRVFSFFMESIISGSPMKLVDGGHHVGATPTLMMRWSVSIASWKIAVVYATGRFSTSARRSNEVSIRQLAELMQEIYVEKFWDGQRPLAKIVEVSAEEFYGKGYEDSDRRIPDITKAALCLAGNRAGPCATC